MDATSAFLAGLATGLAGSPLILAVVRDLRTSKPGPAPTFDRVKATMVAEFRLRPQDITAETRFVDLGFGFAQVAKFRAAVMQDFPGFDMFAFGSDEPLTVGQLVVLIDARAG